MWNQPKEKIQKETHILPIITMTIRMQPVSIVSIGHIMVIVIMTHGITDQVPAYGTTHIMAGV